MEAGDIVYGITVPFPNSSKLSFSVCKYKLGKKSEWKNGEGYDPTETFQLLLRVFDDADYYYCSEVVSIKSIEDRNSIERIFAFSESEIDQCKSKLINNNQKELQKQVGKFAELSFTIGE